jgi:type II restriction enzyme
LRDSATLVNGLIEKIPALTDGQIFWLDKVVDVFKSPHTFSVESTELIDETALYTFGDALRIHHSFSVEAFTKDKFEYVLEQSLNMSGQVAKLANKGNRGHDITIKGVPVSLKTQADKTIKKDKIWISKFMELGSGKWGDDPDDLIGLRDEFLHHMRNYEKIFTLRTLSRAPHWHYELVEIPKALLELSAYGELEMKTEGKQFPKAGYCFVKDEKGSLMYQLYFDGGGERKLQIQHLLKKECIVHANWKFTIPD